MCPFLWQGQKGSPRGLPLPLRTGGESWGGRPPGIPGALPPLDLGVHPGQAPSRLAEPWWQRPACPKPGERSLQGPGEG